MTFYESHVLPLLVIGLDIHHLPTLTCFPDPFPLSQRESRTPQMQQPHSIASEYCTLAFRLQSIHEAAYRLIPALREDSPFSFISEHQRHSGVPRTQKNAPPQVVYFLHSDSASILFSKASTPVIIVAAASCALH
jgi:hypothetical protein